MPATRHGGALRAAHAHVGSRACEDDCDLWYLVKWYTAQKDTGSGIIFCGIFFQKTLAFQILLVYNTSIKVSCAAD